MMTAPLPATSATPRGQRIVGAVFFLIFLLMGSGFFYFLSVRPFLQGMAAHNWVQTPCRIVSSEVKSSSDSDSTTYHVAIAYTYRVQGREYHSDRYQFLRFSSSGRAQKAAVVARYPYGKQTVCYVNPKAPDEAVLDRNFAPAGFFALFPLVFVGVGAAGLFWAIRGKGKAAVAGAASASPEEIWRARPDWEAGRILSSTKRTLWQSWLFAALWNLIATPISLKIIDLNVLRHALNPTAFALVFPLAGLLLLLWALLVTLRWSRFGESVLEMTFLPAIPGGVVEGTVRLNRPILPEGPVQVRLSCLERITTRNGNENSTNEHLLWQREKALEMAPPGDALPVAFALPADARPTTTWNQGNGVFWRLEVHAKLPGVDYKTPFELPVCAGELMPEEAVEAERVRAEEQAEVAAYVPPASSRVRITTPLRGGTEFYFPPGRGLKATLIVLGILAGLSWGMHLALAHHAQLGALFALGVALFIVGVILSYIWTASTRVTMEAGLVTVTQKFLGIGQTRTIAASEITEIKTTIGATSSGPSGVTVYYDLKLVCRDEREISAGGNIPDEREAEWLAAQMSQALQRR